MILDIINSAFEGTLAGLVCLNVRQLLKDKQIKGTHMAAPYFVTAWGFWNCLYYPSLHQWFSFACGAALALANAVWLGLALYYQATKRMRTSSGCA